MGRHNTIDKLVAVIARGIFTNNGFILAMSRASYKTVSKIASANIALLAAVLTPTSLVIDLAKECGLTLVGFSRPDRHVIYANGQRIESD